MIEMRMKKLAALNEALAHWRAKISSGEAEWEARNRAIAAEKIAIARHHRGVNASMARARALQAAQLRSLSLLRCSHYLFSTFLSRPKRGAHCSCPLVSLPACLLA